MFSHWQLGRQAAHMSLTSLRELFSTNSDSPSPRVIRIGQLDSELLDQDLVTLLQEPVNKALSLINPTLKARFEPELRSLVQAILYKLSVWNQGASYGAKLQDLRYVSLNRSPKDSLSPSGLPRRLLLIHAALTIILPYLYSKIRAYALSRAWPDAPSSDSRRKAWNLLTTLESTHQTLGLFNFVAFLWNGRYRSIADRMLGLRLVPVQKLVKRDVSYEFMNRQMVWHAFTEFLLFVLPLINGRSVQRRIARLFARFIPRNVNAGAIAPGSMRKGKYYDLPLDQCAICAENASLKLDTSNPIDMFDLPVPGLNDVTTDASTSSGSEPPTYPLHTPYVASCGDTYCYTCIAERMMRAANEDDGQPWQCLRCGQDITTADRMDALLSAGTEDNTSDYEFSSDIETGTDLEGSIGSYTDSIVSNSY